MFRKLVFKLFGQLVRKKYYEDITDSCYSWEMSLETI